MQYIKVLKGTVSKCRPIHILKYFLKVLSDEEY